jgi:glycosyltransferase involved in cell wall biosynthesis
MSAADMVGEVPGRALRIAWVGALPSARETGGVPGVAADLLEGLTARGHQIDCFAPGAAPKLPERLQGNERIVLVAGRSTWRWDRWYSRTKATAFLSGMAARALGLLALRRELGRRHREHPYDVIYQFSAIETLAVPGPLARATPLVIHPETHAAGELRFLLRERRLAWRCQPLHTWLMAMSVMSVRAAAQRATIRRASLLVCISTVFRDHLVADYGFPAERTVVIPNPVRLARFPAAGEPALREPAILALGRVAVRKGVEDVVALARVLAEREPEARLRIVGGPGLWSDYRRLLEDLPGNAEYLQRIPPDEIPAELARTSVLLQPSRYEPFALTVAEALAAGVPVVATTEVGAVEAVDRRVAAAVTPGDVQELASAVQAMLRGMREDPASLEALARSEARRLFAAEVVCEAVSEALLTLSAGQAL